MSKKKRTKHIYTNGDRLQVYINQKVDSNILDFINKQSDLSSASMMGLVVLYQMYGNVDLDDYLPRSFSPNTIIHNMPLQQNMGVRSQVVQYETPELTVINPSPSGLNPEGNVTGAQEELSSDASKDTSLLTTAENDSGMNEEIESNENDLTVLSNTATNSEGNGTLDTTHGMSGEVDAGGNNEANNPPKNVGKSNMSNFGQWAMPKK